MNRKKTYPLYALTLALVSTLFSSCQTNTIPTPNPSQAQPIKAVYVNPYQSGTYEHFTARIDYPKTYKVYKNQSLLSSTSKHDSNVIVDTKLQRALLMNNGQVVMDYPVSTGSRKFPTKKGSFTVLEKIASDKRSNLYGKIYDANDKVVNSNANSRTDTIPPGGRFQGATMANWMRLTWDGIGMHRGRVPRYPASHGCIRTPGSVVKTVFSKVRIGTPVVIR